MPSENPLFKGGFGLSKFKATVMNDIWPEVLFFTLIGTMVTLVSELTSTHLSFSPQLLVVLGVVLGLVISFRTSTAYERYQEGRRLWTNITMSSRNVAQQIWIHIPTERANFPTTSLQNVIEKKTMINLVQAFSVSLKHYLRGEPGIYYRDLYPLVCVLPRHINAADSHIEDLLPIWHASEHRGPHALDRHPSHSDGETHLLSTPATHGKEATQATVVAESGQPPSVGRRSKTKKSKKTPWDPESVLSDVQPHSRSLNPARDPPSTSLYDYIPLLRVFKWMFRRAASVTQRGGRNVWGKKTSPVILESNVPLEITLHLQSYFAWLLKHNLISPPIAFGLNVSLGSLQDTANNLERIRNTPLPFAYQAHLRMTLWLYLFFLPFQIWQFFHWLTIPGTAFSSFLLLGFLEIGQEIENPFEYDENDLDLDSFCLGLQREIHEITAHTVPDPHSYIFSAWNQPFAPTDRRTAEELCRDGAQSYETPAGEEDGGGEREKRTDGRVMRDNLHLTLLRSWRTVDAKTRKPH